MPPEPCPRCGGIGRMEAATDRGTFEGLCPVCGGEGRVDARTAAEHHEPNRRLVDAETSAVVAYARRSYPIDG
jgi:DnaJ-class molecular chaperone